MSIKHFLDIPNDVTKSVILHDFQYAENGPFLCGF